MEGQFKAQLPGRMEGDFYVVSICYSEGEGRFNGQVISERHPRNVDKLDKWNRLMISRADVMTFGLLYIETPEKYNSLERLANAAFRKGMNKLTRAYLQDNREGDEKEDNPV